jgi:hypothetical protein
MPGKARELKEGEGETKKEGGKKDGYSSYLSMYFGEPSRLAGGTKLDAKVISPVL